MFLVTVRKGKNAPAWARLLRPGDYVIADRLYTLIGWAALKRPASEGIVAIRVLRHDGRKSA